MHCPVHELLWVTFWANKIPILFQLALVLILVLGVWFWVFFFAFLVFFSVKFLIAVNSTTESGSQDIAHELLTIIYFFRGNDGKNRNRRSSPFSWLCQCSVLCLCFLLCTVKIVFIFLFSLTEYNYLITKKLKKCWPLTQNTDSLFATSQFMASKLWSHVLSSAAGPV